MGSLHLHLGYVSLYSRWGRRAIREPNHPRQNSSLAESHLCERAFNVERVTWSTAKGVIRNHRTHRWALRPVSTLKAHRESSPHTCSSERKILAGLGRLEPLLFRFSRRPAQMSHVAAANHTLPVTDSFCMCSVDYISIFFPSYLSLCHLGPRAWPLSAGSELRRRVQGPWPTLSIVGPMYGMFRRASRASSSSDRANLWQFFRAKLSAKPSGVVVGVVLPSYFLDIFFGPGYRPFHPA